MYKIRSLFIILLIIVLSGCNTFDKKKQIADDVFLNIEEMVTHLTIDLIKTAKDSVKIFQNAERLTDGLFPDAEYEFYDNIMYHNPIDRGHGKFLYTGYYPVGETEINKVKVLEHIIPSLQWLIHDSDYSDFVIQSYLITFDTLIVFYPYTDLISFIPPLRNIQDRGGWKTMKIENNPDKTFKWTPPYVDTTGKGFIVDILYPVYNQNFMEAFIGLDITISTLKEQFFDNLNEKMLLIDKKTSQIIAISDYAVDLLGVENIEAFRYLEMIDNSEIAKQVMPDNLVLNKTDSLHMRELWNKIDDSEESIITIQNKEHRIYRKIIDDPQWYLVIIE